MRSVMIRFRMETKSPCLTWWLVKSRENLSLYLAMKWVRGTVIKVRV